MEYLIKATYKPAIVKAWNAMSKEAGSSLMAN
jgi:hypothetical protein